ncbi:MAG: copper resistance protein NlpE [Neisseria sp.]|nr:copper resistance protein NlpE [Neisseria sp.]
MLKTISLFAALALAACAAPAQNIRPPQADIISADRLHNGITPNWSGTYSGTLPCDDCNGIRLELTLNPDLSYRLSQTYLRSGRNDTATVQGSFNWQEDEQIVQLDNYADGRRFLIRQGYAEAYHLDGTPPANAAAYRLQKIE